jgi:hypothetical protein
MHGSGRLGVVGLVTSETLDRAHCGAHRFHLGSLNRTWLQITASLRRSHKVHILDLVLNKDHVWNMDHLALGENA